MQHYLQGPTTISAKQTILVKCRKKTSMKRKESSEKNNPPRMLMFQRAEVQYLQETGLKADYCTSGSYIYNLTQSLRFPEKNKYTSDFYYTTFSKS